MAAHIDWKRDTAWSAKCSTVPNHLEVEEKSFAHLRGWRPSCDLPDAIGILAPLLAIFRHGDPSKISDLARNFDFRLGQSRDSQ